MKTFSKKKGKLNYTIHNPNTVEDTAKVLLDVLVQVNERKVKRKLQELADYAYETTSDLHEEKAEVKEIAEIL